LRTSNHDDIQRKTGFKEKLFKKTSDFRRVTMSDIPSNLKYSQGHEWVRLDDDGSVVIGITDHAQQALGELVYVELPEAGQSVAVGDACAVVESVKAASDVYAPVAGEVSATNESLADEPERVNSNPYDEGWLLRVTPANPQDLDELMDADAYKQFVAESDN
jgi:glycine cleavage system H protein